MYQVIYRKAKPIIVDNVEFPSIVAASKMLQVPTGDISLALREGVFRGKPIRYKNAWDVPQRAQAAMEYRETLHLKPASEKPVPLKTNTAMTAAFEAAMQQKKEEPVVATVKKHRGKDPIPVEIDGKIFASLALAGEYYKIDPSIISCALRHNRDRIFKGMKIAYADKEREAAIQKALTLPNAWNKAGVKVVKQEEVKPLEVVTKEPVKENVAEVKVEPKVVKPIKQQSGIEIARNILKGKALEYINCDNFKVAKELLNVIELIKE